MRLLGHGIRLKLRSITRGAILGSSRALERDSRNCPKMPKTAEVDRIDGRLKTTPTQATQAELFSPNLA